MRVIGSDGQQIGVLATEKALALANEQGMDLVEIVPHASPPVVKIVDFAKYRYQQQKALAKQKKNAKKVELKTVRLSARIGLHDLEVKAKQTEKFLAEGDIVRLELRLRGREQAFGELGQKQFGALLEKLSTPYRIDAPLKRLGPSMGMTIAPATK